MKRALFVLLAALTASASTGCTTILWPGHGESDPTFSKYCASPNPLLWFGREDPPDGVYRWGHGVIRDDDGLRGRCNCVCPGEGHGHPHGNGYGNGYGAMVMGPDGQPIPAPGLSAGAVAYPYYTTRGPRDFFLNNPPSIGP